MLALGFPSMAQNRNTVTSYLEIYDLDSRTTRVVKSFPFRIEAPNWTPEEAKQKIENFYKALQSFSR